jgi:hypothetical protein
MRILHERVPWFCANLIPLIHGGGMETVILALKER